MTEQTRKCSMCRRELPLSEFYKTKAGKYLYHCKECNNEYCRARYKSGGDKKILKEILIASGLHYKGGYQPKPVKIIKRDFNILGGVKIYVLNHTSGSERKYNVVHTSGKLYQTDNKDEFLQYLKNSADI